MATRLLASPLGRLTARRVTARAWSASAPPASSDEGASKTFIKRYPLVARGSGTQCVTKARNVHDIRTDVPKAMGGADEAPQPVELLLAALLTCEQATAAYVARHMSPRFKLKYVHFSVVGERDDRGATALPVHEPARARRWTPRVCAGEAVVHVRGPAETQARVDELARLVKNGAPSRTRCAPRKPPRGAMATRSSGVRNDDRWLDDRRSGRRRAIVRGSRRTS